MLSHWQARESRSLAAVLAYFVVHVEQLQASRSSMSHQSPSTSTEAAPEAARADGHRQCWIGHLKFILLGTSQSEVCSQM